MMPVGIIFGIFIVCFGVCVMWATLPFNDTKHKWWISFGTSLTGTLLVWFLYHYGDIRV